MKNLPRCLISINIDVIIVLCLSMYDIMLHLRALKERSLSISHKGFLIHNTHRGNKKSFAIFNCGYPFEIFSKGTFVDYPPGLQVPCPSMQVMVFVGIENGYELWIEKKKIHSFSLLRIST